MESLAQNPNVKKLFRVLIYFVVDELIAWVLSRVGKSI
jgi:hypothetical protein